MPTSITITTKMNEWSKRNWNFRKKDRVFRNIVTARSNIHVCSNTLRDSFELQHNNTTSKKKKIIFVFRTGLSDENCRRGLTKNLAAFWLVIGYEMVYNTPEIFFFIFLNIKFILLAQWLTQMIHTHVHNTLTNEYIFSCFFS